MTGRLTGSRPARPDTLLDTRTGDLLALENKLSPEEYASSGRTFGTVLTVSIVVFLAAIALLSSLALS